MIQKTLLFALGLLILSACQKTPSSTLPAQGIKGKVLWLEGNQMPSIGQKKIDKALPLACTVYICKPIKMEELKGNMPLFEELPQSLIVASAETNKEGHFAIELPQGHYSLITSTPSNQYFANRSNGQGVLHPITVEANKLVEVEVKVDYLATY